MEHESEPTPEHSDSQPQDDRKGCGKIVIKLIVGALVLFIAVVAFVFGVCFLG